MLFRAVITWSETRVDMSWTTGNWEMISFRKRDSCFILQNMLFGLIQPDDQLALRATSRGLSGWCVNLTTDLYKVPNLGMLGSLFL